MDRGQIILVDGGHAVLSMFSPKAQTYAAKMLKERGVQIRLGTRVKEVGSGHVVLSDGTRISTHTVIWAGGLKAASLSDNLGVKTGHGGRIDVEADLTVPGLTGVYAGRLRPISRTRTVACCLSLLLWRNSLANGPPGISCRT